MEVSKVYKLLAKKMEGQENKNKIKIRDGAINSICAVILTKLNTVIPTIESCKRCYSGRESLRHQFQSQKCRKQYSLNSVYAYH